MKNLNLNIVVNPQPQIDIDQDSDTKGANYVLNLSWYLNNKNKNSVSLLD